MAAGQILFQRFYFSKSFVKHSMEILAMACINLAAKIEEAPRRMRDVINVFHHIKQVRNGKTISPLILDQNYISLKNQVIKSERRVLKELGFCVHVQHPHKMIVMFLQVLDCERNQKLVQRAWNYMNDSFRSVVFVKYSPNTIACACIFLAARQLQIPLPNNPPWYHIFEVDQKDIVSICVHILRLYNRQKPHVDDLEKLVNERKKVNLEAKMLVKGVLSEGATPNSRPVSPAKASPSGSADLNPIRKLREEEHASDSSLGRMDTQNGKHRKKRTRSKSRSKSRSYSSSRSRSRSPRNHRRSHSKKHKKDSHHNNNVNNRSSDKYRDKYNDRYHDKHSKYDHNDRYSKHDDDHWNRSPDRRSHSKKSRHRSRSRSPYDRHRTDRSSSKKHNGRSKDRYSSRR